MKSRKNKLSKSKKLDRLGNTLAAMGPLIGFLLFGGIPLILAAVVSLTELHSTDLSEMKFIGLENFKTILTNGDNRTYSSYLSTIIFSLNIVLFVGNTHSLRIRFFRRKGGRFASFRDYPAGGFTFSC